ncbi:acyltransferase [Mycolicibacterium sp. 624]|uniref:acyltransferase n=1 Tax=Mycolicibacterium sp. 624 TaxID=3156314 RepID=UPI00339A5377
MTTEQQTTEQQGPFRSYPWPLERLRDALRCIRLKRVKIRGPAQFSHGNSISFAKGADVRSPHSVELGHHISFGKNFTCEVDVRVGSHVLVSSNVSFVGRDHPFDDPAVTVYEAARLDDTVIEIGSDVLIGFGTIVVGPAKIGDGCIVGAGSVVVGDLPPSTICVGVPAKPVRQRYPDIMR